MITTLQVHEYATEHENIYFQISTILSMYLNVDSGYKICFMHENILHTSKQKSQYILCVWECDEKIFNLRSATVLKEIINIDGR